MGKSSEKIWWSLFAIGGVTAAMLTPITMIMIGIGIPTGWVSEGGLYDLLHNPLARLYLFLVISLPLFHGAHRLLFTLVDLGLKKMRGLLSVVLYGGAIIGTALAAILLIRL